MKSHRKNFYKLSKKALLPILGAVLFLSTMAMAEVGEAFVLCKHDKTVRTLRIEEVRDSGCRAFYTKQGVDQVIGMSQNKESCGGFVVSVRKNLEGASWNCRDVKESRVSTIPADEIP